MTKVAAAQIGADLGETAKTAARVASSIRQAGLQGVQLAVDAPEIRDVVMACRPASHDEITRPLDDEELTIAD